MNVAQMQAHSNVSFGLVFENKYPRPGLIKWFLLKIFVKEGVVSNTPYKKNELTAPVFMIKGVRDFAYEKPRLVAFIQKTQALGSRYFDGMESA